MSGGRRGEGKTLVSDCAGGVLRGGWKKYSWGLEPQGLGWARRGGVLCLDSGLGLSEEGPAGGWATALGKKGRKLWREGGLSDKVQCDLTWGARRTRPAQMLRPQPNPLDKEEENGTDTQEECLRARDQLSSRVTVVDNGREGLHGRQQMTITWRIVTTLR